MTTLLDVSRSSSHQPPDSTLHLYSCKKCNNLASVRLYRLYLWCITWLLSNLFVLMTKYKFVESKKIGEKLTWKNYYLISSVVQATAAQLLRTEIINVDNCKIYHDECPPNGNKNMINNTPSLIHCLPSMKPNSTHHISLLFYTIYLQWN